MSDYIPQRSATQVQHPWRATFRTVVAVLVGASVVLPVAWGIVSDELTKAQVVIPDQVAATILWLIGLVAAAAAIVTRIMAIPHVSDALTRLGMGPTPRGQAVELTPDPAPLPDDTPDV